jgi:hypothetical protein
LRRSGAECCKAQRQKLSSAATGEETEVADADETLGEQMEEKAAQEFIERQRHQLLLIMVSGVAPTKGHLAVVERNQSVVGDGYAVGITAEVVEHILRTTEGWFGVDDPMFSKQWPEPRGEDLRLSEWG